MLRLILIFRISDSVSRVALKSLKKSQILQITTNFNGKRRFYALKTLFNYIIYCSLSSPTNESINNNVLKLNNTENTNFVNSNIVLSKLRNKKLTHLY